MDNYTLIITEKPDAARRIAQALDVRGKPKENRENGVPYFVAQRDKTLVIVPAIGHLYTVAQAKGKGNGYPVFDCRWVPRYVVEKRAANVRKWIETISHLAENASEFIDACDYDIEGSIIGYSILKCACFGKDRVAKRMKYSTLTSTDLEKAYNEFLEHLDFSLIEAGLTRHELDWLYGINLSRALTLAAKHSSGRYTTLSTGRVQGPTLKFLVSREREIKCFVPTPYWTIHAKMNLKGEIFDAEYGKRVIETKTEAEKILLECKGKKGIVSQTDIQKVHVPPPVPFDLGMLQGEAYRLFGFTPSHTSDIAQRLYLDALISYPRTSSQRLPPSIGYGRILKGLRHEPTYTNLAQELLAKKRLKPREGTREDPAHPAIYPTGNNPERNLDAHERRLWDLIVRRFMAVFGEPALKQSMRVSIDVDGHRFLLHGVQVLFNGWMRFYEPYAHSEEFMILPLKQGDIVDVSRVSCDDRFTPPPPRYNPSSLLKKMERENIGTKATRAETIKTLFSRKYIENERINATELGFAVIEVLHKYCKGIISVKLTRDLEERMERIQSGQEERLNVLQTAIENLEPSLDDFKKNEDQIGKALSEALRKERIQERTIGDCPSCKTGKLLILYSRKTGKRFIGCTNYFKNQCKTAMPLPQKGLIKSTRRKCRTCGWPIIIAVFKGRRPWQFCVNSTCPGKEERKKLAEMHSVRQRN